MPESAEDGDLSPISTTLEVSNQGVCTGENSRLVLRAGIDLFELVVVDLKVLPNSSAPHFHTIRVRGPEMWSKNLYTCAFASL
jgi:hypothetical protein